MESVSGAALADQRCAFLAGEFTLERRPILRYISLLTLSTRESVVAGRGTRDTNDLAMYIAASTIGAEHISPMPFASSPAKARKVENLQAVAA